MNKLIFNNKNRKEMRYDQKKERSDKHQPNQTLTVNTHLSESRLELSSASYNYDPQNPCLQQEEQPILDRTESIDNQWAQDLSRQRNHQDHSPVNFNKLYQIDQQEKEIEKVAEELITLKQIIKKLKISIGVILEQEIQDPNFHFAAQSDSNYSTSGSPLANAMKKLQQLQDRRITPEYKEWISQYFHKIFNDIKQIKAQFLNYQKAKRKSENIFDLGDEKPNPNLQKSHETLIQYQIKCRLLQSILKLCKYKGIFSSSEHLKYSKYLTVFTNQVLIENLQKYKMNYICQKVKTLKKSSPDELFYQWKTIHDQLQIVNLQQIQRFYKEKKQISYLNSYDNNQNGILIIGASGVGKTTLFLSLAGQKMIKKKIKSRSGQFQNYQAADQEIANQYKTSPFSTSCTREPAKLQAPKKYTFPEQLCLIDTAGFEENRSGEIDIMNTLYTYETIQEMKKLRVIIVISEKNIGQRDQGLNKFAKNIARYFTDYEEVKQSILFVLTKFDNIKKLKIACDNILKGNLNQKDTNEYRFIKHLQESIIYKDCIEFRPTDQNIIFDAEYHIDPVEMDGKLKKLYKSLLKRFPIHHEYENDYINLEYSRETKDKLIQKKCYLENMIRKLYKEGNNSFRFYLEQLMFLENKINKINNKSKAKYANDEQNTFDILSFIEEINQEVISKFKDLVESYFTQCNPETLKQILQIKNRYSNLFLGNLDAMIENADILEEDYQYIFQEITESINSLKIDFDKIIDERQKQIGKMMKYKAKVCHDIKNKKWLCAVLNFTKEYYNQNPLEPVEQPKQLKQSKIKSRIKKEQVFNKEYKALLKVLKKNQQKFKQEFSEELNIMDQEISNYLMKKPTESNTPRDFLVETEKQIFQAYNNFKRLVFHQEMFEIKDGKTLIEIPSDEKIFNSNLKYIISILKQNLNKEFEEISQNIELMNMINHNLQDSDPDISRNVFQEVQRYSQKIKMYYSCDKPIYELMQSFYNRVMKKVNLILKEINQSMFQITKKQSQDQIKVVTVQIPFFNQLSLQKPHKLHIHRLQRLNSNLLYCYLCKINQIDEFPKLRKQMEFQVRCFNLKLKNYVINLQKHLEKYDQRLSMFKNIIKKENQTRKNTMSLELYSKIKEYIDECIEIEHQIKLIHHYFRNQQNKQNAFKFEHLSYIKSIFYRHSRFLQSEKKSVRSSYESAESSGCKPIAFQLIIDYMILEEIYIQKIKFDDSNEFKKLHNAYENSFESKIDFINEFDDMKTHQLKMLNECKHRILNKLIEYPLEFEGVQLEKIQTQDFQSVFEPKIVKVTVNIFLYYVRLKQIFEDIETLNNEEITHDFRVIELSDISSPLQTIQQKIIMISNLVGTVTEIASLKYLELKDALSQIVLDDFIKSQIVNYLHNCHLLSLLFDHVEKSSLQGLEILEGNLQEFKRKSLVNQIKQFVDKSESIFYRLSKNIDSIELQHLQNTQDILQKPQSTKEFLKLLKSQCLFFVEALQNTQFHYTQSQVTVSLKDLLRKMEDSQNQMDFLWEDQMKELQKSSKDPKNSLQKLIKLYEQHITKVSTQKTLQYRFVELKKHQLAGQIKQFLADPTQNKVEKGQALCEQLKSYLNFLKSMKLKMVVNLNGIQDIKNIEEMDRLYEKQATRSQAQKSQTDMTPSELRQNLMSVDAILTKRQSSERYSVSDFKPTNYAFGINERPIQRKSVLKNSRISDEKSSNSHSQKKIDDNMQNYFSNMIDNWSKNMAINKMEGGKSNKMDLAKSQSQLQIRNKNLQMSASIPNLEMTRSNILESDKATIDHVKRYTINGKIPEASLSNNTASMKKSSINLKYAPPVLTYQQSIPVKNVINPPKPTQHKLINDKNQKKQQKPINLTNQQRPIYERNSQTMESAREIKQQNIAISNKNQPKLPNSPSNQSLHLMNSTVANRIMSKHKTQSRLNP